MEKKYVFDYRWPWWGFAVLAYPACSLLLTPVVVLWEVRPLTWNAVLTVFGCGLLGLVMTTWIALLIWGQKGRHLRVVFTRSAVVYPVFARRVRLATVRFESVREATVYCVKGGKRFRGIRLRLRTGGSTSIVGGLFVRSQDAEDALRLLQERLGVFSVPVTTQYVSRNPLVPRQFTIRGLLILTTIVAVLLGLRSYVGDGKFGSVDLLLLARVVLVNLVPLLLLFAPQKALKLAGVGYLIGWLVEGVSLSHYWTQIAAGAAVSDNWYPLSVFILRLWGETPGTAILKSGAHFFGALTVGAAMSALLGAMVVPAVWYATAWTVRRVRALVGRAT